METAAIAQVRRFNRLVTQRVGALGDRFLARDRPLGESRVLWEIGEDGCDVRALRSRLDLDSGYLSRVLGSLHAAGLVTIDPKPSDKRVRVAHLTPAGCAERNVLERRSDRFARSLLEPLDQEQRDRLVAAMRDVERLLTAAIVEIAPIDPAHPLALHCLREYFAELDRRFDSGFDSALGLSTAPVEFRPPAGLFLLATIRSEPVGCGALKLQPNEPPEIKRMWVAGSARGLGVGRRMLRELESRAAAHGARSVRLNTNRALTEAISMYRTTGYREIDAFDDDPYAHLWFEKPVSVKQALSPVDA